MKRSQEIAWTRRSQERVRKRSSERIQNPESRIQKVDPLTPRLAVFFAPSRLLSEKIAEERAPLDRRSEMAA